MSLIRSPKRRRISNCVLWNKYHKNECLAELPGAKQAEWAQIGWKNPRMNFNMSFSFQGRIQPRVFPSDWLKKVSSTSCVRSSDKNGFEKRKKLDVQFFRFPFDASRSSSSRGGAVDWITKASVKTRTYLELCIIKGCGGGLVVSAVGSCTRDREFESRSHLKNSPWEPAALKVVQC